MTVAIKDAVERAFIEIGGHEYLKKQARDQPVAFMSMLNKFIPSQVQAEVRVTKMVSINFLGFGQLIPGQLTHAPMKLVEGELVDELLS